MNENNEQSTWDSVNSSEQIPKSFLKNAKALLASDVDAFYGIVIRK